MVISPILSGEEHECKTEKTKENAKPAEKKEEKIETAPPRVGNFSLPSSQQPAGLFAFGGNILAKGEIQFYFFADEFVGKNKLLLELLPSVLFGITDDLSIFFVTPYAPELRDDGHSSNGLQDAFIQLEYAFYSKKTDSYEDQCTILGNVTFPTGSLRKNPATGYGSPTFFIGATYYHMMVDWFVFTCPGAILTTSNHHNKVGDQFLYQFGFGRNIPSPEGCIYAWMLEIDGQYGRKNRVHGEIDRNSGGNIVLATPSLWISTKHMLLQFGISLPLAQNLFGNQNKVDYAFNLNFAWSFYPDEM